MMVTTTTLPPRVLSAFRLIPQQAAVRDYHGPWNKLLNYVFTPDSAYTVIPREYYSVTATKEQSGLEDIDAEHQPQLWFMKFEVQYDGLPVLLVLVSAPAVVESSLARKLADGEIRRQMTSVIELCPLPTLRAISAFGQHMCMYTWETSADDLKREIQSPLVADGTAVADTAPLSWWNSELLTPSGQCAFLDAINRIQEECKHEEDAETEREAVEMDQDI